MVAKFLSDRGHHTKTILNTFRYLRLSSSSNIGTVAHLTFQDLPLTLLLLALLSPLFMASSVFAARHNMTEFIEYVGNPYAEHFKSPQQIYARNIWDMIEFQGKIYFGAGNSSNIGPATNAGPVPIIVYDPKTDLFSSSFVTSDEQVDAFYIFNNALYVPGHDPKEDWRWGNLYKTTDGQQWIKKRTIPFGVHTLCLATFDKQLFSGLGTAKGAAIAISDDLGDSWQFKPFPKSSRFYEFLQADNQLYAVGVLYSPALLESYNKSKNKQPLTQVVEYNRPTQFTQRYDLTARVLFPDTSLQHTNLNWYKITHPQNVNGKVLYIGAYPHNDIQSLPFGLYYSKSLRKDSISVKKIAIPNDAIPWDTYQTKNFVYVLTNRKQGEKTEVTILRSSDLEEWEELFYFDSTQLVRSFAFSQGTFYFSLGCEVENPRQWQASELQEQTGDILKIVL